MFVGQLALFRVLILVRVFVLTINGAGPILTYSITLIV